MPRTRTNFLGRLKMGGAGAITLQSGNISGAVRTGAGAYTISTTSPLVQGCLAIVGGPQSANARNAVYNVAASSIAVVILDGTGAPTDTDFDVAFVSNPVALDWNNEVNVGGLIQAAALFDGAGTISSSKGVASVTPTAPNQFDIVLSSDALADNVVPSARVRGGSGYATVTIPFAPNTYRVFTWTPNGGAAAALPVQFALYKNVL